ncbi:MAG: hypothetical protein K8Q88_06210 [Nitrosarchaeum sp.]|nr:hypothetical protein [Nitrosarchaeum sp.]
MKNKSSDNDVNKEFHHRPTIRTSKTTAGNLPSVELYDNDPLNEQKIQRKEKPSEPSKHMSLMFPWDLYAKIVEYSNKSGITVTDITVEALRQYLLEKITQNDEMEKLKEKVVELEKDRSGGEHEFNNLEKTIKKIVQEDPKI